MGRSKLSILKKAMKVAHKNGWMSQYEEIRSIDLHDKSIGFYGKKGRSLEGLVLDISELLFQHEFAEALWGNYLLCIMCGSLSGKCKHNELFCLESWQYHLQQLVLEDNRLSYIGRFI